MLISDVLLALTLICAGIGGVILLRSRRLSIASIVGFIAVICYYKYRRTLVIEESIQIIDRFGVQIRVKNLNGREKTKFIEKDKIESIFLHEYVQTFEVHFAIAIMVRGEKKMVTVFKDAYPGYQFLKRVLAACNEFTAE